MTGEAAPGVNLIGSGLDADLIFIEQGLEPDHFRISLLNNSIEIKAHAGRVGLEGGRAIEVGESVVVPHPAVIHVGMMSIRWSVQDASRAGPMGMLGFPISILAIVILGSLGIGALVLFYYGSADESRPRSPGAELRSELALNRSFNQTPQAAAKALQEEADRAGLVNIKVGYANGVVSAKGTVPSASVTSWQKVQQWFDHRTKGAQILVNEVLVKDEKAPSSIAIEAVWRGPLPYLLISGQKYFVGALLDSGWTVSRIEDGRVLLSRNGSLAALHY
nr:hypothetical protein [Sinorhizobium terangae]